jgi:hypothetical protein
MTTMKCTGIDVDGEEMAIRRTSLASTRLLSLSFDEQRDDEMDQPRNPIEQVRSFDNHSDTLATGQPREKPPVAPLMKTDDQLILFSFALLTVMDPIDVHRSVMTECRRRKFAVEMAVR